MLVAVACLGEGVMSQELWRKTKTTHHSITGSFLSSLLSVSYFFSAPIQIPQALLEEENETRYIGSATGSHKALFRH
jgi:hypothetical protein